MLSELPPLETSQAAFNTLVRAWEQAVDKHTTLAALKNDYDAVVAKQTKRDELQTELAGIEEAIQSLQPLSEAQTAFENLKSNLSAENEKLTALTTLQNDYDAIRGKQVSFTVAQDEFQTLNADYISVDRKYKVLYEQFLRGRAGILARGL
ncbi:MAG: hypothetical protein LBU24_00320 [Methanocalculaceae archaeon]|jgi:DNA repair exonuclease SbcCD ATPase subunit|nr:hypothetical protein [Methanocalculaceae archaeon]